MKRPDHSSHRLPEHSIKLPPWGATLRKYRLEGKRFGEWLESCSVELADQAKLSGKLTDGTNEEIVHVLTTKLNANLEYLRHNARASQSQIEAFREAALNEFPGAKRQ
jgi:hypothetical protein